MTALGATIIADLDEAKKSLVKMLPGSPEQAAALKIKKEMQEQLDKYFLSLQKGFPYSDVTNWAKAKTTEAERKGWYDRGRKVEWEARRERLRIESESIFAEALAGRNGTLQEAMERACSLAYRMASVQVGTALASDFVAPVKTETIAWANKHLAKRVTKMTATTQQRIARTVANGLEAHKNTVEIAKDIRQTIGDMTIARSELIATTEMNTAMSEGSWAAAKKVKAKSKRWFTSGSERVCQEKCAPNEAAGRIPINESFPSGHDKTPAHPRCQCAMSYSMAAA